MKRWIPLIISVMAMTGYAIAQRTTADQGRPGREGPWFITTSSSSGVSTTPQLCTTNAHKTTSVGVAATTTPAAQLASRRYVTICNSLQNAGNPTVKCRVDGTPPVMAAATKNVLASMRSGMTSKTAPFTRSTPSIIMVEALGGKGGVR